MLRAVVFGVFGLLVGSFLTVVTHRIPRAGQVVGYKVDIAYEREIVNPA